MLRSVHAAPARLTLALIVAFGAAGCSSEDPPDARNEAPATSASALQSDMPVSSGAFVGHVTETMDAGGYTYVHLERGSEAVWAAGPLSSVNVGDEIRVNLSMKMPNFTSASLERTFDVIYFVNVLQNVADVATSDPVDPHAGIPGLARDGETTMPRDQTHAGLSASPHGALDQSVTATRLAAPEGGYKVARLWADRESLDGQTVTVRGHVVKYNGDIMGRNWLHIQDGSGSAAEGTHDLTVTTDDEVAVGDIVTVTGLVTINQDFGAGYSYDLLVSEAEVVVDPAEM